MRWLLEPEFLIPLCVTIAGALVLFLMDHFFPIHVFVPWTP